MNDTIHTELDDLTDAQLLDLLRAGRREAYGVLYERYRIPATRLARSMRLGDDSEDVVADAFVAVLAAVDRGAVPVRSVPIFDGCPVVWFARVKAGARSFPTADEWVLDSPVGFAARDELEPVSLALGQLSSQHRRLLWLLHVEGWKPGDVAAHDGVTANGVSAMGTRARAGFREAYARVESS